VERWEQFSVADGISILGGWPAEIVLLDFDLGDENGSSFLANASTAGFRGKTLLLTAGVNELEAADLIRQGIPGVVLKHSPLTTKATVSPIHR
jgi:DNA-binding NarL/FixJ family response regulator